MARAATLSGRLIFRAACLPRVETTAVWLAAPPALAGLVGGFLPLEAIDPWWSLLLGAAPAGGPDPIVFTPLVGPPANVQWLAQRLLAGLYELGGFGLLLAVRAFVLVLTLATAELVALRHGAGARAASLATLLILPTVLAGAAVRPQLLAVPLFALLLVLGGPLVERHWAPFALGGAVALWANVHGSFVLAPPVLALLALGGPRRLAAVRLRLAALALLAGLANPWGLAIYPAVLEVTRSNGGGASSLALEWRPLDLQSSPGIFFLLQLGLAGLSFVRTRRARGLGWALLAAPLAALALTSGRHTIWFGLAVVPLVATGLAGAGAANGRRSRLNAPLVSSLALLGLVGLGQPFAGANRPLAPETPIELADRLAATEADRLFAFSDWGGYLAWRLRPAGRVYIDDRFEQHSPEVWASYRSISRAEPGWQERLDEAGVDALALEPRQQAPLVAAVERSESWQTIYRDEASALFVRR